ncbi:hypothetical protein [Mesorhizobium sp. INR15]|uniref:hypothetical protein n=1 Tax=Mesorhizobium sp. INR15 TaxID=2654248 RepID=UPI001896683C|nr:hypothetical protein [Mesorhizobium sp. INR15]QPC89180.1 hypothetical protein GA829_00445 [Mesorhizobium sp. INR15]
MSDDHLSGDPPEMDAERFAALAAAYGGDLRRWPRAEQTAAAIFAQVEEAQAILRRAGALDAMLDRHHVKAPERALQSGILRAADGHLSRRRRQRFWWFGLGLAGIGLAGAIAGLGLVTVVTPDAQSDHHILDANVTAFGDASPDGDTIEEDL